jgi:hypothetical protein
MFKKMRATWADIRKAVWEDNRKYVAEKNVPPATAIAIYCPDGRVYMKIWHDVAARRICMEFANMPGVWVKWTDEALPDTITALVKLLAKQRAVPQETEHTAE